MMENVIFFVCFLVKQTSSATICEETQGAFSMLGSMGLDNLTVQAFGFGGIVVIALAYKLLCPKQNETVRTEIEPSWKDSDPRDDGPKINAEPEHPKRHTPGHVVFKKTGVEVLASAIDKQLPCDLALQAVDASESVDSNLLEENEVLLSPAIKLMSITRLNGMVEVCIPHGANMVLSCEKWNIILKEFLHNKWVPVRETEGQGIKNFVPKANHAKFDTDHLSTFAIVGKYDQSSLSVFKRMKVAAFCDDTKVGEDLVIRLYCFDDCEWSFERIMTKEQKKGGKLVSSIESLNFSVNSDDDVEITVRDVAGWHLDQDFPKKLSHESLKNSFNIIPQCDLVFHPTCKTANIGFFVAMTLTQQSSGETVLYASATLKKKDPSRAVDVKKVHSCRNDVCGENLVKA